MIKVRRHEDDTTYFSERYATTRTQIQQIRGPLLDAIASYFGIARFRGEDHEHFRTRILNDLEMQARAAGQ